MQVAPYFKKSPEISNSLFLNSVEEFNNLEELEKPEEKGETEKIRGFNAEKQLMVAVAESNDLPVVTTASKLETNPVSVYSSPSAFSASSVSSTSSAMSDSCNSSVVPFIHDGTEVSDSIPDAIAAIFEYWKIAMNQPESRLDHDRTGLIRRALEMGYSVQQLCNAIIGCSLTPHNRGENDQNQRYNGLHIILRNADQIDRFVLNFHHPPKKITESQKRLMENQQAAADWAREKINNTNRSNYA